MALISGTSLHGSEHKDEKADSEEKVPEVGLMQIWALNNSESYNSVL